MFDLPINLARHQQIIGIEKLHEGTGGAGKAGIARAGEATIGLPDDVELRSIRSDFTQRTNCSRFSTAIIDYDDFQWPAVCHLDRLQRVFEVFSLVVARNND